jgi:5-methylcytosine-specific restriction endonuclease McrA
MRSKYGRQSALRVRSFSIAEDRRVWRRAHYRAQNGRCFFCEVQMIDGGLRFSAAWADQGRHCTLDHLHPLSLGGLDQFDNTAAVCRRCNEAKKDMTVDEFRTLLQVQEA